MRVVVILLIGLLAGWTQTQAQAQNEAQAQTRTEPPLMVPADLGPGISPWNGLVPFPRGTEDVRVFIQCVGFIERDGHITDVSYYSDDPGSARYIRALQCIMDVARAKPAVVNGTHRGVQTVFSVLFLRRDGEETIALFQSDLSNRAEFGFSYIAPQLYYGAPTSCGCGVSERYSRRYIVDVDGTAKLEIPPEVWECRACRESRVATMKFLPGRVGGKDVKMAFEVLIDP